MSEIEVWLDTGKSAAVAGHTLQPTRHPLMAAPLAVTRSQATVYYVTSADDSRWLIKKFLQHTALQPDYVAAVATVVPPLQVMRCAWERRVLKSSDLQQHTANFCSRDLATWLEGTLLMPGLRGEAWGTILTSIADGSIEVALSERLQICAELALAISALELAGCSHRDLSAGNLLVDVSVPAIHLIDWDAVYSPVLEFQPATTLGTEGYMAPWVEQRAEDSWCPYADRFALAICIVEMLTVQAETRLYGDGSLFEQSALGRSDAVLTASSRALIDGGWLSVEALLRCTWNASSFERCPSPSAWLRALTGHADAWKTKRQGVHAIVGEHLLRRLDAVPHDDGLKILTWSALCREAGVTPAATSRLRERRAQSRLLLLERLREAMEAGDNWLIAQRYNEDLLGNGSLLTVAEQEQIRAACKATSLPLG